MNKNKLLYLFAIGAVLSFTLFSASASFSLMQNPNQVLTLKINTPGGKPVILDNFIANYGNVENGLCHIKKVFNLKNDYPSYRLQVFQKTYSISSILITSLLGPDYGCVNNIIIYKGRNYQTGYIYLTWDKIKGQYTHARPNNIVLDLSK